MQPAPIPEASVRSSCRRTRRTLTSLGAHEYVTLDVTQEYYAKSLKYMIYGNVLRNNCYPISVSSERIFQAIAIARYAKQIGADAIAHGSTGAGNDQIRFDMTFQVLAPGIDIITLTRDKELSRKEEVDYLNDHGFFADFTKPEIQLQRRHLGHKHLRRRTARPYARTARECLSEACHGQGARG